MKLSVYNNDTLTETIDLERELFPEASGLEFLIGRSEDCHVFIDDKRLSREAIKVIYSNNTWSILNISKPLIVEVNNKVVDEIELKNGDSISFLDFRLAVDIDLRKSDEDFLEESTKVEAQVEDSVDTDEVEMTETQAVSTPEVEDDDDTFDNVYENEESTDEFSKSENTETNEFGNNYEDVNSGEVGESDEYSENEYGDDNADEYAVDSYDDDGSFEDDDSGATQVVQSFANFELELLGEHAPYDKFSLDTLETYIGRDEKKCQIILNDPEVSSVHAVIRKSNIICTIEDLGSGNGTILNGERINKDELTNNDEFIIGDTTFTFKIQSDFMSTEEERLMPVEENQIVEVEEVVEIDEDFAGGDLAEYEEGDDEYEEVEVEEEKSLIKKYLTKEALKDPEKRKKVVYVAVGLIVLFVFLTPTEETQKITKKSNKNKDEKVKEDLDANGKKKIVLSPADQEFADHRYRLAKEYLETGKYSEAMFELEAVFSKDPDYKESKGLYSLAKDGVAKLEELERKRRAEIERQERDRKVKEMIEKATKAVEEKNVSAAEALFTKISELDPENFDLPILKNELNAWKEEQDRIAVEKAQRESERKRMVDSLAPGKKFYNNKEWFNATSKLEQFMAIKQMDEDLVNEATKMLRDSKAKLDKIVLPMLGKARSLKEGQDLKGAYEVYHDILNYDPSRPEVLNEMDEIRETLKVRSMKIYREAIISESLSLFNEAKEKLQEVQQMSPKDSEYYEKATEKLKNYME